MSEDLILLIESATDCCSAALSDRDTIIAEKYTEEPRKQASLLVPFIKNLLEENSITINDLSAVAISCGPGSYTGLRVGLSCAKGICFGSGKPLIAVDTLACMAQCAIDAGPGEEKDSYIIPMIDARRMEVYTAVFDEHGKRLTKTESKILDASSFNKELEEKSVLFTGNGAEKFQSLINNKNARFTVQMPHASGMRIIAWRKLKAGEFEDIAYFEPFYLKDFVAGKPRKILTELLLKNRRCGK